jgi:hypothetical protein
MGERRALEEVGALPHYLLFSAIEMMLNVITALQVWRRPKVEPD